MTTVCFFGWGIRGAAEAAPYGHVYVRTNPTCIQRASALINGRGHKMGARGLQIPPPTCMWGAGTRLDMYRCIIIDTYLACLINASIIILLSKSARTATGEGI